MDRLQPRPRPTGPRSSSRSSRPSAAAASCSSFEDGHVAGRRARPARRRRAVARARRARVAGRAQRRRQDDADRDARRSARARRGERQAPVVEGKLRTGHNVKLGFLSQHAEELSRGHARTVLEATTHPTKLTPNKARALLGHFLFSGEDAEKPLEGLSGGERRRLSLAILVQSGANVLILDEPTNHLDLESREALEDGAQRVQRVAAAGLPRPRAARRGRQRTVAIEDATLHSYVGGWPEYVRVREERARRPRRRSPTKPAQAEHEGRKARARRAPRAAQVEAGAKRDQQRPRARDRGGRGARCRRSRTSSPTRRRGPRRERTARATARHEQAKRAVDESVRALGAGRRLTGATSANRRASPAPSPRRRRSSRTPSGRSGTRASSG